MLRKRKVTQEQSKLEVHTQHVLDRILMIKRSMDEERPNPIDLHELGICYYHLQNFEMAINFLSRLLTLYPDYTEFGAVHALQALCLIEKKEYSAAKRIIENRLEVEKVNIRLLSMLAYVCEKLNLSDKAILILKKIVEYEPQNTNALNSLGYLLSLYGSDKDKGLAMECLLKALKAKPLHPAYLDSLGVFYSTQGDYTRSYQALSKAIKQAPDNSEIFEHLQDTLEKYKGTRKIIVPKSL